jgi:hypothetical protein
LRRPARIGVLEGVDDDVCLGESVGGYAAEALVTEDDCIYDTED